MDVHALGLLLLNGTNVASIAISRLVAEENYCWICPTIEVRFRSDSHEKCSWQSRPGGRRNSCLQRLPPRRSQSQWIVHSGAGSGRVARTVLRRRESGRNHGEARRTPPVHLTYYAWTDDWTGTVTKADLAAGRIPLVNWEPHKIDFTKIVDGSLDATIVARANGSKALGKKFFLDFAAEMNGDEAWGGNNAPLYVAAYRHIHDIFVAAGATNVIWAWCPNVTDINGGNKNTMDYYPGDAYVDWTGVDGYNWGTNNGGWQTFHQVFQDIYPLLAARKKPIMIGEMSSAQVGGNKGKWIDEIIPTLRASFPLIKCVVWFDINKEADWRISSSPESEAAFIRMARDPYFNP